MGCSGSNVRKTKQVIFVIGGPFSGKEVLCPKIQSAFGWTHLDLEDLITAAKEQNVQTVNDVINNDLAVPSDKLCLYMKEEFNTRKYNRVLLEDFPKNEENVKQWNEIMNDYTVELVIYVKCSTNVMKERMEEKSTKTQEEKEIIAMNINSYESDMKNIISNFESKGILLEVDGEKAVEDVFNDIKKEMINKGLTE